eukprot:213879-Amphidinium_carterae.1
MFWDVFRLGSYIMVFKFASKSIFQECLGEVWGVGEGIWLVDLNAINRAVLSHPTKPRQQMGKVLESVKTPTMSERSETTS